MFMMIQAIVKIIVQSSAVSLSSLDDDNDENIQNIFKELSVRVFDTSSGPELNIEP